MGWLAESTEDGRKQDCDVCGFPWREGDLQKQRGVMACPDCIDEPAYGEKDDD